MDCLTDVSLRRNIFQVVEVNSRARGPIKCTIDLRYRCTWDSSREQDERVGGKLCSG
jgi:hypothetical protein